MTVIVAFGAECFDCRCFFIIKIRAGPLKGPLCRALPTTRNGRTLVSADHLLDPILPIKGGWEFYFFWTVKRPNDYPRDPPDQCGVTALRAGHQAPWPHPPTTTRHRDHGRKGRAPKPRAAQPHQGRQPPKGGQARRPRQRPPGHGARAAGRPGGSRTDRGEREPGAEQGREPAERPRGRRATSRPGREPPPPPGRTELPRTPDGRQGGTGGRPEAWRGRAAAAAPTAVGAAATKGRRHGVEAAAAFHFIIGPERMQGPMDWAGMTPRRAVHAAVLAAAWPARSGTLAPTSGPRLRSVKDRTLSVTPPS